MPVGNDNLFFIPTSKGCLWSLCSTFSVLGQGLLKGWSPYDKGKHPGQQGQ